MIISNVSEDVFGIDQVELYDESNTLLDTRYKVVSDKLLDYYYHFNEVSWTKSSKNTLANIKGNLDPNESTVISDQSNVDPFYFGMNTNSVTEVNLFQIVEVEEGSNLAIIKAEAGVKTLKFYSESQLAMELELERDLDNDINEIDNINLITLSISEENITVVEYASDYFFNRIPFPYQDSIGSDILSPRNAYSCKQINEILEKHQGSIVKYSRNGVELLNEGFSNVTLGKEIPITSGIGFMRIGSTFIVS